MPVPFPRSLFSSSAPAIWSVTGSASILAFSLSLPDGFAILFVGQPDAAVRATGTGRPASSASIALRASRVLTSGSLTLSSIRPWYRSLRSRSNTYTCGIAVTPNFAATACVSPS